MFASVGCFVMSFWIRLRRRSDADGAVGRRSRLLLGVGGAGLRVYKEGGTYKKLFLRGESNSGHLSSKKDEYQGESSGSSSGLL